MIIKVKDIINVDTISKGNNKPWEKISEYMDKYPSNDMMEFDFKNICVVQPCASDSFMKLLSRPNFGMILYAKPSDVVTIRLSCTLNGLNPNRIKNVEAVVVKQKSAKELHQERQAKDLLRYFHTSADGMEGDLRVTDKFDQISSSDTISYIEKAIEMYNEETGIKNITIDMHNNVLQSSVVKYLAQMVSDFKAKGILVNVLSDDKHTQNMVSMGLDLVNTNYTIQDKYQIMLKRLKPNHVGLLTKYKNTKSKDEFGRMGKGEKIQVRVAIFMGFVQRDGEAKAWFRSFNSKKLYTRQHWYLEHDQEVLNSLSYDDIYTTVDELGIYNDFVGTKYHFSSLVQYGNEGTEPMYIVTDDDTVIRKDLTIPERAKIVFDDFGIEYDHESLDAYIEETNRILNK